MPGKRHEPQKQLQGTRAKEGRPGRVSGHMGDEGTCPGKEGGDNVMTMEF